MTTTTLMFRNPEEHRRRLGDLLKSCGGTEGYIGEVTLGSRTVAVPSSRPPAGVHGPEGSYMAQKSAMRWPMPANWNPEAEGEEVFLLDEIHRYYLQALASMGKEAVSRHARGMLFAGYTYGSLADPVSNIVANALWYDTTFPPASGEVPVVKMLSEKAIFRMACRSLHTLVAFMMYYVSGRLSYKEVCWYLVRAKGNLQHAVQLLHENGIGLFGQVGAFRAAIEASDLPNNAVREAHLSFVTSYYSAWELLQDHHFLIAPSFFQFRHPMPSVQFETYMGTHSVHEPAAAPTSSPSNLSRPAYMIAPSIFQFRHPMPPVQFETYMGTHSAHEPAAASTSSPTNLSRPAYRALRLKMHSFRMEEELSLSIVQLALQKLALQLGEPYELHTICGKVYVIFAPESYYHINFLASPEGKSGTCFACGYKGVKLIHPVDGKYNGVEDRTGDHRFMPVPTLDFGAPLNEDYVFFEPDQHPEVAKFLEANYSYMNEDQVDLSFMWFENYLP